MTVPFLRTTCACPADVANCYRQPGYLSVGDLDRILETLGSPVGLGLTQTLFRRGRAVVGNGLTGRRLEIATIVLAKAAGRCVFLDEDERCRIHAVAPAGCQYFDVHQPAKEWQRRSLWLLRQIGSDPAYRTQALTLKPKEK